LNITQSLFALQYRIQKDRCLVLVASAGSATTGTLELPAFGAHIGPREETLTRSVKRFTTTINIYQTAQKEAGALLVSLVSSGALGRAESS